MSKQEGCEVCHDLQQQIDAIKEAFPVNDLGKPGYHEHRTEHLDTKLDKQHKSELAVAMTKQIAMWLLSLVLAGVATYLGLKS